MVGRLPGSRAAEADSNRGEAELRCAHRGRSDFGGGSAVWNHASESVSECVGRRELGGPAAGADAGDAAIRSGSGALNVSAGWELDFWGKFRRATEAARANLVATEWSQKEVISTLVANVASAYFQLRALDLSLEISKRTLSSRQESLRLTQILANGGSTSMLDVRQAEQLVFTAAAEIPVLEQQIEQQENLISILLGENPGSIKRGLRLTEQVRSPEVPAGLTSALLERRPDIQAAEQQLIEANAEIGVARAAYFPQIR